MNDYECKNVLLLVFSLGMLVTGCLGLLAWFHLRTFTPEEHTYKPIEWIELPAGDLVIENNVWSEPPPFERPEGD